MHVVKRMIWKILSTEVMCNRLGTTLLNNKCLQMNILPKTFEEAQEDCSNKGGQLFEPNFEDAFLFQTFFKQFPAIFGKFLFRQFVIE